MWELIEITQETTKILDRFSTFNKCEQVADYLTYLNDGMALVICAVTL